MPERPSPATSVPAFEQVYRGHADFVWRLLRHMAVEEASRADVFHEVFLIVHRRLAEFDARASLTTWLFGITRNVVLHHRRGFARHQRRLRVAPAPAPQLAPDEAYARLEARELVERFLADLPEDQRLLFLLAEIEGARAADIATQLGLNINTLYSRLQALRRQFTRFLAEARPGTRDRHGSS